MLTRLTLRLNDMRKSEMGAAKRYLLAFAPFATVVARAQDVGTGILNETGIMDILCGFSQALTGPIGVVIGIIILAVGGLMIAFGGKRSIGFVLWGIIGVGIALAAPSLILTLFPGASASGTCGVGA